MRRGLLGELLAGTGQADEQAPAIHRIGAGLGETARGQPIDDALDGGDVHRRQAAELILRAWPGLDQLRQRRPLRRRQVAADVAREDHGVALPYLAQDEADL